VVNEAAGGGAGVEVPQAEGAVPGAGQSEGTIRGDHDVLDEVRVTGEGTAGVAVALLIAGEVPDDDGVVTRSGQDHVSILGGGGNSGNPAAVAPQFSTHFLLHFEEL
jgi:hypothetical protein